MGSCCGGKGDSQFISATARIAVMKKKLKTTISFFVSLIVALIGVIKFKHPFSYLVGVPAISWVVYLLTNAMCSDLLFGETTDCLEKSIYKDD